MKVFRGVHSDLMAVAKIALEAAAFEAFGYRIKQHKKKIMKI